MGTVTIEWEAVVGVVWLAVGVVHLHHHGELGLGDHGVGHGNNFYTLPTYRVSGGESCDVGPCELVSLVDGVCVPLCPVHQVREHGDTEGVSQVLGGEKNSSGV